MRKLTRRMSCNMSPADCCRKLDFSVQDRPNSRLLTSTTPLVNTQHGRPGTSMKIEENRNLWQVSILNISLRKHREHVDASCVLFGKFGCASWLLSYKTGN